jgi:hypothetical protein
MDEEYIGQKRQHKPILTLLRDVRLWKKDNLVAREYNFQDLSIFEISAIKASTNTASDSPLS